MVKISFESSRWLAESAENSLYDREEVTCVKLLVSIFVCVCGGDSEYRK